MAFNKWEDTVPQMSLLVGEGGSGSYRGAAVKSTERGCVLAVQSVLHRRARASSFSLGECLSGASPAAVSGGTCSTCCRGALRPLPGQGGLVPGARVSDSASCDPEGTRGTHSLLPQNGGPSICSCCSGFAE